MLYHTSYSKSKFYSLVGLFVPLESQVVEIGPRVSFMINIYSAIELYHKLSLLSSEKKTKVLLGADGFIWKQDVCKLLPPPSLAQAGPLHHIIEAVFLKRTQARFTRRTLSMTEKAQSQNDPSTRPAMLRTY